MVNSVVPKAVLATHTNANVYQHSGKTSHILQACSNVYMHSYDYLGKFGLVFKMLTLQCTSLSMRYTHKSHLGRGPECSLVEKE